MTLRDEIAEAERLLEAATFPGIKSALQSHVAKLRKQIQLAEQAAANAAATFPTEMPHMDIPETEMSTKSTKSSKSGRGIVYTPIESFAWEQGGYNSASVTVYVDLDEVGTVKDKVEVNFGKTSFDLRVMDLHGKNYRLVKDNLEKDIIPEESSFVVKKNKVVVKLQKVKGEYSYDHWTALTAKKKREDTESSKKDPMGGIMDMMKTMYEEGDENMKKVIGEAMLKSQRGEKPSAPDMNMDI